MIVGFDASDRMDLALLLAGTGFPVPVVIIE
jgi:hypothetical protein